jgi:hypothetical protein
MGEWQYDCWTPTRSELLDGLREAKRWIDGLTLLIQRSHGGPGMLDMSEAGRLARKPYYTAYDEAQRLRMDLLRQLKKAEED